MDFGRFKGKNTQIHTHGYKTIITLTRKFILEKLLKVHTHHFVCVCVCVCVRKLE